MSEGDFTSLASEASAVSKRELNMQRRRERISRSAARIIVEEGLDNLTLAKVAEMADLTVPTIHNLFGKKRDIYTYIATQAVEGLMHHIEAFVSASSFEDLETGVNNIIEEIRAKEDEFKAGFLLGERSKLLGRDGAPYKQSLITATDKFVLFVKNGDLAGKIDPEQMAKMVADRARVERTDWMHGRISLDEFKHGTLFGFYVVLLSDATTKFRKTLHTRIASLGK